MKKIIAQFVYAICLSGIASSPSFGQEAAFDVTRLQVGCADAAGGCQAGVANEILQLQLAGLTPEQVNTQLGVLASMIVAAAQTFPGTPAEQRLARALRLVAAASTDSAQTASIRQVARVVAKGNASSIDIDTAYSASPS